MDSTLCFMLLVVLGIAGSAISASCPKRKSIYPCTCQVSDDVLEIFCHDEDMSLDDLKKVLSVFDTQYALEVELFYVNLGTVPTDFFEGFNIRLLDLTHCKYEQIPDEEGRILVGLEDTLEEFIVIGTVEKSNSPLVLDMSHLHKLTALHFSYNEIPELTDDWFKKGPSSLTHLYFNGNGIKKIGSNVFANLPNLKELWLDGNQFGGLKRSMLPNPATHLDELQLDDNWLDDSSIPEDFFNGMPALKSVSLGNNILDKLSEETFGKIWAQLDSIDFLGNALNCEDSVLKWMFEAKKSPAVLGTCGRPGEREGKLLWDVIQENQ